jgi:hypothetical protein
MAVSALRWFKAALFLQVLLLGYLLATEALDLFPWNDVAARLPGYDLGKAIAVGTMPSLASLGIFALGFRPLAILSVIAYGALLAWELWTWWPRYLFGADAAWQSAYEASFSRTLKLLPASDTNLPPDAQHLVLQLLLIAVIAVATIAASKMPHL